MTSTSSARPKTQITTTKKVVNPDRSMSLTTTTIRNLGSFEIVTTKTTPIQPKKVRKKYASSVMSYESDLDSVIEEEPYRASGTHRKSRQTKQQHFPPVYEVPVVHTPPDRALSPSKSALKPTRRASLQSTQSEESHASTLLTDNRARSNRVSFSSQGSTASIPKPKKRIKYIKRDKGDSDDSDSGNSVYSDASEYLPIPVPVNGANRSTTASTTKPPVQNQAALAAAKSFNKPSNTSNRPSPSAAAAARSSLQVNGPVKKQPTPAKLTEAAVLKHNAATRGTYKPTDAIPDLSEYLEEVDNDDVISMNSTSSWQPRSKQQPKMVQSMRTSMEQPANGGASVKSRTDPQFAQSATSGAAVKVSTNKRQQPKPPTLKHPSKDYSQYVLKRTPSNSSFEREKEKKKANSSAFKMMTLRSPRKMSSVASSEPPQTVNGGNGFAAADGAATVAKPFKSRFADSDSEDEVAVAPEPVSPKQSSSFVTKLSSFRPRAFSQSSKSDQAVPVVTPDHEGEIEGEAHKQHVHSPGFVRRFSSSLTTRTSSHHSQPIVAVSTPTTPNESEHFPLAPPSQTSQTPPSPVSTTGKQKKKRFGFFSHSKKSQDLDAAPIEVVAKPIQPLTPQDSLQALGTHSSKPSQDLIQPQSLPSQRTGSVSSFQNEINKALEQQTSANEFSLGQASGEEKTAEPPRLEPSPILMSGSNGNGGAKVAADVAEVPIPLELASEAPIIAGSTNKASVADELISKKPDAVELDSKAPVISELASEAPISNGHAYASIASDPEVVSESVATKEVPVVAQSKSPVIPPRSDSTKDTPVTIPLTLRTKASAPESTHAESHPNIVGVNHNVTVEAPLKPHKKKKFKGLRRVFGLE